MNTVHTDICPLCGGKDFQDYLTCKDHYASQEDFKLTKCSTCGFVLTQDFPAEDSIGSYYNVSDYISHSDTRKGLFNKLYHIARSFALKSKAKTVIKYAAPNSKILLDYGSGTGYFLNKMKSKGWLVTGIEKDEGARDYAKYKFGLNVQSHEYIFQISEQQKDTVTMWHVLEHIENLNAVMHQIHVILKDDGTAIIALPNRESLDAEYYKNSWAAYDVPRHLWHFSQKDFEVLANKHNFSLVDVKPMYLDAFYISMLSQKYKGTFLGSLMGLLRGGLFFLKSLSNKQKCSSLIYILKKKK